MKTILGLTILHGTYIFCFEISNICTERLNDEGQVHSSAYKFEEIPNKLGQVQFVELNMLITRYSILWTLE